MDVTGHAGVGVQDEPGQAGRENRIALGDPSNRVDELDPRDRLGHVASCTGPDHRDDVLGSIGHRERQKADVGVRGPHGFDHRLAATVGEVDIQEHHVGLALADQLDGGSHLVGLPDDPHGVTEFGPHPRPEQVVIVDQEDPRPALDAGFDGLVRIAHVRSLGRDTLISTSVPSPGDVRTVARPPWRSTRAQMDSAIPRRSSVTSSRSNPRPRSRTKIETRPGSTSANNETTGAPDHLAEFTVASRAAPRRALSRSSSGQSPTVTTSTDTPWASSASRAICWTPAASESAPSPTVPGSAPSNNQARSSRSEPRPAAPLSGAGPRTVGSWPGSAGPNREPGRPCPPDPRLGRELGARRPGRGPAAATRGRTTRRTPRSPDAPPDGTQHRLARVPDDQDGHPDRQEDEPRAEPNEQGAPSPL